MTAPREPGSGYTLAQVRARAVLRDAGLEPTVELVPVSSVTNEVWLTPSHVVRVSGRLGTRLHREAILARYLPPAVRYPAVTAHGGGVGDDWLVVQRVPGEPLAHRWPDLERGDRRRAVSELATALRALHRTPVPAELPGVEGCPHLLDTTGTDPLAPLRMALAAAGELPGLPREVLRDAAAMLESSAPAIHAGPVDTLIHGDLTFENVMWDGHLTAVLDLEWARPGPADLDLDILLRVCAHPQLHVAATHEARTDAADYRDVPEWLAADYPELFGGPGLLDRLRVYALGYSLREVLEQPSEEPIRRLPHHHPLARLSQLVRGEGYLDDLAHRGVLA